MKDYKDGKYTVIVYSNGDKHWLFKNFLHREDGPAIEFADGSKYWYIDGRRHREDGPAVEECNGKKYWYLNGVYYNVNSLDKFIIAQIIQ